jgi:fatty acid desaturase
MSMSAPDRFVREKLASPELHRHVNSLRRIDNRRNWFYLAREYSFLALVLVPPLLFYHYRSAWGIAWPWTIPVTFVAIVAVGACQHRLTTLGHEASHYMLFRHPLLNELISDWFCMFPMWSDTHQYRLQHLAHHQFPNDAERDPDVTQMQASGHRFRFPMSPRHFLWQCVIKQCLWPPGLVRYIRIRARYSAIASGTGPYDARGPRSNLLVVVGIGYLLTLAGSLTLAGKLNNPLLLGVFPAAMLAAILAFYGLVPNRLFRHSLIKPAVSRRWTTIGRITYLTLLFTGLAWLSYWTDEPWGLYYVLLWIVPIGTSFSFFMIMRQVVQHGNAGQDRLTNTRVFHVGSLIRFAVFPLGMDYHLPHHLYPMVPHYCLRELHRLLLSTAEYRQEAMVVEGYFFPAQVPRSHPTVVDLMARADLSRVNGLPIGSPSASR